ncbi:hypothetical protein Y032_0045g1154 [Ancylostoma ceylanicum]|uniref:Uncharacterized protein n=1 Tax=Ancylostoma ceylanicum TaxID=53326 RepID=A0A016UCL5_9BILA|nr:hypothetical protein Y032_0045g1154 [Ancylostoma ceylanicum]
MIHTFCQCIGELMHECVDVPSIQDLIMRAKKIRSTLSECASHRTEPRLRLSTFMWTRGIGEVLQGRSCIQ